MDHLDDQPVIFFDGVCNFCNGIVNLIIRKDKNKLFFFSALQSEYAKKFLENRISYTVQGDPETIILFYKGTFYQKTDAVIEISRMIGGAFLIFMILKIFPRFLRDFGYDLFARVRYFIFGKKETCMVPSPELRSRFLN